MGDQPVIGGFFGMAGGLIFGSLQWIYYSYYNIIAQPLFWEMYSWSQIFAYIGIICGSFVCWIIMDNCLRSSYSECGNLSKLIFGGLFGFSGAYTLIALIYASYWIRLVINIIIFIGAWIACLFFQDDISFFLR